MSTRLPRWLSIEEALFIVRALGECGLTYENYKDFIVDKEVGNFTDWRTLPNDDHTKVVFELYERPEFDKMILRVIADRNKRGTMME